LLEPFREKLAAEVFDEPYLPPISDGSGSDRNLLLRANNLLRDSGCILKSTTLYLPSGEPFEIEFLNSSNAIEAQTANLISNLRKLGIKASFRLVDPVQFIRRREQFDFDIFPMVYLGSLTPGPELRSNYGSSAAVTPGSRNLAGIKNDVVDAFIESIASANTRPQLIIACRCLDRILREGRFWIPMWYRDVSYFAYQSILSHPNTNPKFGTIAPDTWWWH
jgi:microcin C transport system substrate-binding protein